MQAIMGRPLRNGKLKRFDTDAYSKIHVDMLEI